MIFFIIVIVFLAIVGSVVYFYMKRTNENFKQEQIENKVEKSSENGEIILYYTSWCPHSTNFLPEWEKFEKYANANMNIKVTTLLCEGGNESICNEKRIPGFPYVILYKGDNEIHFEDERTCDALKKFVGKHM